MKPNLPKRVERVAKFVTVSQCDKFVNWLLDNANDGDLGHPIALNRGSLNAKNLIEVKYRCDANSDIPKGVAIGCRL